MHWRIKSRHEFAQRPLACRNRRPVVVEIPIIHADHQFRFLDVAKALRNAGRPHLARLQHRLGAIARAQLASRLSHCGHGIDHHAHSRHASEMIPDSCGNRSARPHDPAHLGNGLACFRDEMQDKKSHRAIERAVIERQGTGVGLADRHARVAVDAAGLLDEDRREIDGSDRGDVCIFRQSEGQAAGSATDIEDLLSRTDARKCDEFWREQPAPAAHELLVARRLMHVEDRGHRRPRDKSNSECTLHPDHG